MFEFQSTIRAHQPTQDENKQTFQRLTVEKEGQKPTDYMPTKAGLRLLEVLIDPASRMKTVTEVCRMAKIHRDTYYELFKKKGFVDLYKSLSADLVKQKVGPLVNALIHEATRGSAQHLKIALVMAGIYQEKRQTRVPEMSDFAERLNRAIESKKLALANKGIPGNGGATLC